jgi:L-lactate dehydrogenase (cytochrome)
VQHAEKRGIKALFITVDAPQLGRREKVWLICWSYPLADMKGQDMRMTFDAADPHEIGKSGNNQVDRSRGAAKAITVSCT